MIGRPYQRDLAYGQGPEENLECPRGKLLHPGAKKLRGRTLNASTKYVMNNDLDRSFAIFLSDSEIWVAVATTSSTGILYHHIQRHSTC